MEFDCQEGIEEALSLTAKEFRCLMNGEAPKLSSTEVRFLNIVVSEKGLSEFAGNRRVVFIARDRVQLVEIKHGLQAERPLLQGITASLLLLLGTVGAFVLTDGGLAALRWGLGFLFFGALGAWLLWESLRRGYYLRVVCVDDSRKLAIRGRVQKLGFREFIQNAAKLGYDIRDSLSDKTFI